MCKMKHERGPKDPNFMGNPPPESANLAANESASESATRFTRLGGRDQKFGGWHKMRPYMRCSCAGIIPFCMALLHQCCPQNFWFLATSLNFRRLVGPVADSGGGGGVAWEGAQGPWEETALDVWSAGCTAAVVVDDESVVHEALGLEPRPWGRKAPAMSLPEPLGPRHPVSSLRTMRRGRGHKTACAAREA